MIDDRIQALVRDLGIVLDDETTEALEREIRRQLVNLQTTELNREQADRRVALTEALVRIQHEGGARLASTELVTLSPGALAELVKLAAGHTASEQSPEERMRKGVQVAATQARKDFRNSRTLPLAGFGALVAFVWAQRESFGIDLTGSGQAVFGWGALVVVVLALEIYLFSWTSQQHDARRLRSLYLPDVQAGVLQDFIDRPTFMLGEFREGLGHAVNIRAGNLSASRLFSTVDLESALHDASEMAIERFLKLGVIEPVESWSGLEYRSTGKFSTNKSC
ncbi:hypothetical protein [Cryobacterium sp. Y11]|uniref:hypothetical protein n=1 Tax=Cryobacterium sp. Y11 TaxID=2045016 RepID=UPI000CE55022|nr:hypothetical protein [Cryobacterium sp. Y11]